MVESSNLSVGTCLDKRSYRDETKEVSVREDKYFCDTCGKEIFYDIPEGISDNFYKNRLEIYLNPGECANSRIRYDLCTICLEPMWIVICRALGVDPDDEHRIGDDEFD